MATISMSLVNVALNYVFIKLNGPIGSCSGNDYNIILHVFACLVPGFEGL